MLINERRHRISLFFFMDTKEKKTIGVIRLNPNIQSIDDFFRNSLGSKIIDVRIYVSIATSPSHPRKSSPEL